MYVGIQVATEEEGLGGKEEKGDTKGVDEGDSPESGIVAQELGNDASHENAQAHAKVPRDEDGGVGCASLVVGGHAYGHILEGGPHVTIAKSKKDGATVVANKREEG